MFYKTLHVGKTLHAAEQERVFIKDNLSTQLTNSVAKAQYHQVRVTNANWFEPACHAAFYSHKADV